MPSQTDQSGFELLHLPRHIRSDRTLCNCSVCVLLSFAHDRVQRAESKAKNDEKKAANAKAAVSKAVAPAGTAAIAAPEADESNRSFGPQSKCSCRLLALCKKLAADHPVAATGVAVLSALAAAEIIDAYAKLQTN